MSNSRGGTWRGRCARSPGHPLSFTGALRPAIAWSAALACAAVALCAASARADECAGQWTQAAILGPGARGYFGVAYDAARERVVLFGGSASAGLRGDTWEWDGTSWTLRSNTGPSPRHSHSMCYDPVRQRVLLFGGIDGANHNDTWEWDGASWTLRATTGPSPRHRHVMVYDTRRSRAVLFGGYVSTSQYFSDTWEWDGATATWTQVNIPGPPARYRHGMAYDELRGECVVFGGFSTVSLNDTWVYDGASWAKRGGAGPSVRDTLPLTYDTDRHRVVLFGGRIGMTELGDTWEWTGAAWVLRADSGPLPRHRVNLAFDSARRETVLFGGFDFVTNQNLGDTWVWQGGDPPVFSLEPTPLSLLTGANALFTVAASGTNSVSYQWRRNGAPLEDGVGPSGEIIAGSHSDTLSITGARAPDTGVYDCVATDSCGSKISASATLAILCPGDTNGDNIVDFADLNIILSNFGASGAPGTIPGDLDADGDCDFGDLNIVLSEFGLIC